MLRRLIYISRSLIGDDQNELEAIVACSARRNEQAGLTGLMWTDGESFAQVIEGESDALAQTLERIRNDPRHGNMTVLLDRAVGSRQFGDWSMRFGKDDTACTNANAFMTGFAMGERTLSAKHLYKIVTATCA